MKKKFFLLAALTAGLFSCDNSHEDLYDPEWVREQYENQWVMNFGEIDPNQNWNMARAVTANVDLDVADDYTIRVYTANPLSSDCTLLADMKIESKSEISFDVLKGLEKVFVTIEGKQGLVANGYYPINNNVLTISAKQTTTRSMDCTTTAGEIYLREGTFWYEQSISYSHKFSHLENVYSTEGDTWLVRDFIDIVGNDGVFSEGSYNKAETNLVKWGDVLGTNVVYTTTSEGPVIMSLNFGATRIDKMFGYFYYKDGEDPNDAVRYVLLPSTNPCNHIKYNGEYLTDPMKLASLSDLDASITGTKYYLTYFDEVGNASYDFPSNVNIVFFLASRDGNNLVNWSQLVNSSRDNIVYNPYATPSVMAVTYNYGNTTFMGIEDGGGDDDMNDLLFFVTGNFEKPVDINPNPEPEVTSQTWIVACEDLGAVGDYDFNDIVFSVSYVSGQNTVTVTPLAAGGTLAAHLYCGDKSLGEIHSLFGIDDITKMINTRVDAAYNGINDVSVESMTVEVASSFSMSDDMGGFSLVIRNGDNEDKTVIGPSKGTAPQMICVPKTWRWPTELVNIGTAYPKFGEWGSGYNTDWYTEYDATLVY